MSETNGNGAKLPEAAHRATEKLGEAAQKTADAAKQAAGAAKAKGSELMEESGLAARVREHPYGMVGAAFGLGYVAGGGLFSPTTARVIEFAVKLAALPPVREKLLEVAEAAVDAALANTESLAKK
jgi:hypothetical protein